ncbi:MAG: mannose-1-phosphate guanylyltransferase [Candidatus Jacksonbacteria bacterium]|nr:mannose-1-phosphate guanylyltransferase [Candidatus Jacksonbacteria bacterium]MBT6034512.1 mannose-1-phosphate guanylyltransferase [Candidatus Jacksonbacteria bacterium]MBT6301303.1 mannose-1-phosphate guanylyltransferase [Candidatus Jacksonbacteria bacterium]MBT6756845.1 mannose-1-phosphate guanylyltransferase [Candidatus Jacksonbacteria bacterium]MBT6955019.1 mannose-1-phosphate guanylyltransferase [Candidatus Jacksonbacteria bacterium]
MKLSMLILAGGHGTRLWPISRKQSPKQVKPFLDQDTLLQKTINRLTPIVGDSVFVSTHEQYKELIKEQSSEIADGHIIAEPAKRDNAAAICLSIMTIAQKDPDCIVGICGSDAFIKNEEEYHRLLKSIPEVFEKHNPTGVLLGVVPHYPETGYGYIEYSDDDNNDDNVYPVNQFVEKPDQKTAEEYISQGNFLWNPLQFFFPIQTLIGLYEKHTPEIYDGVKEILNTNDKEEQRKVYESLPTISIDYAIMEKVQGLMVIPAHIGWADIGHWRAVQDILTSESKTDDEMIVKGKHVGIDTKRSFVYSEEDRLVATIGLEDFIIIDTPDALLVCPKDQAQRVKEVVQKMKEEGHEDYL